MAHILVFALFIICGVMGMVAIQSALLKCWKASGLSPMSITVSSKQATLGAVYSSSGHNAR